MCCRGINCQGSMEGPEEVVTVKIVIVMQISSAVNHFFICVVDQ
jgi:hypothetical protein